MVARFDTNESLNDTLNYNEKKAQKQLAVLIHSANYPKDTDRLGFTDKLKMLQKQAALNQRTKRNSVHIKIAFHPSEKLDKEKMTAIADLYMQRIGFGDQPYLVYEHKDTAHPHMHIVTTNIRPDGTRIYTDKIGVRKSSPACKEIEQLFGLLKAEARGQGNWQLQPVDLQKVQYGKMETKRAISNVVNHVVKNYKFTSIAELNAILQPFNVCADQGGKDSRIYQNNGLVYRVLDDNGTKVGIPIKASSISSKPTMKTFEKKFRQNAISRQPFKQHIKNSVDMTLLQYPGITIQSLAETLKNERIQMVLRKNDQGIIYGITYVDHQNKVVFNGSDLGKEYSAKKMQERCLAPVQLMLKLFKEHEADRESRSKTPRPTEKKAPHPITTHKPDTEDLPSLFGEQGRPAFEDDQIPYELTGKRKKKKKKRKP